MKQHLNMAVRFTIATTIVFGLIYPLVAHGIEPADFPEASEWQPDYEKWAGDWFAF